MMALLPRPAWSVSILSSVFFLPVYSVIHNALTALGSTKTGKLKENLKNSGL